MAGLSLYGQGLSGQRRLIKLGSGRHKGGIDGNQFGGTNEQTITDLDRIDGHIRKRPVGIEPMGLLGDPIQ